MFLDEVSLETELQVFQILDREQQIIDKVELFNQVEGQIQVQSSQRLVLERFTQELEPLWRVFKENKFGESENFEGKKKKDKSRGGENAIPYLGFYSAEGQSSVPPRTRG